MKLYLSSYRIPDLPVLVSLVGKQPAQTKVAIIPNAKDYYAPRARQVKIRHVVKALSVYGYQAVVVDLNTHTTTAALSQKLQQFDLLWVMGGNTFCLREAMKHSGFDKIIQEVVAIGVVYAGESAGACVAGPDLHDVELADDAEFAEKVIWRGLGLMPQYIVPHADNPDFGETAQAIIAKRAHDSTVVVLNDNQAWVVHDDKSWKVTGQPANSAT